MRIHETDKQLAAYLLDSLACPSAREWASGKTLAQVWQQCPRASWLAWLAMRAACDGVEGFRSRSEVQRLLDELVLRAGAGGTGSYLAAAAAAAAGPYCAAAHAASAAAYCASEPDGAVAFFGNGAIVDALEFVRSGLLPPILRNRSEAT